jgi:hypothetical protein
MLLMSIRRGSMNRAESDAFNTALCCLRFDWVITQARALGWTLEPRFNVWQRIWIHLIICYHICFAVCDISPLFQTCIRSLVNKIPLKMKGNAADFEIWDDFRILIGCAKNYRHENGAIKS